MQSTTSAGRADHTAPGPDVESATPPIYFLSAHTFCCEIEDGAIILDLHNDAYLGIDAQHLSDLRTRIANWPDPNRNNREAVYPRVSKSERLITELLTRGILTTLPTSMHPPPARNPTMAMTPDIFAARRGIPFTHVAHFLTALLKVLPRLRRGELPSLLEWLRQRQSSIHREHAVVWENALARLASFLWLRTWCYTARQRCLFDSLALSVYLTKGMVPCTFVIGVASKPFLAHSWVQIGESVLNDSAEHVQSFKIILSIGGE
jgi:hypothetical protein